MKLYSFLLISLLLFSCGKKTEKKEQIFSEPEHFEALIVHESVPISHKNLVTISELEILIPDNYLDYLERNFSQLDNTWKELYFNESKNNWFVDQATFKIRRDYHECIGDSLTSIESNRKTILFFKGIEIASKEIQTVSVSHEAMLPERPFVFTFNSEEYTLNPKGKVKPWDEDYFTSKQLAELDKDDFRNYQIDAYSLHLNKKGAKSQEILNIPLLSFNTPYLLWIGDLDQDGKPDFLFDTAEENMTTNVELYLSSEAEDGNYIKKVAS
ncbi:MAG: hypothetical protein ABI295_05465, partial [Xanthomarina sp.]